MMRGIANYTFCYLSLIMDAYTKEIVGWSVGPDLTTKYPKEALQMALSRLQGKNPEDIYLIHHSDRRCQYASIDYVDMLRNSHIQISMTESGNPKANPQAERNRLLQQSPSTHEHQQYDTGTSS